MADRAYVSPKMRKAAPDLCKQIDDLRTKRRTALDRNIYMKNSGKAVEADEALQQIAAIDAKIAPLYAQARNLLLQGTASVLTQQSAIL